MFRDTMKLKPKSGSMFGFLIKIALLWWLLSVLFKWLGKQIATHGSGGQESARPNETINSDVVHSGTIEDADFEEIDDQ